MQPFIDSTCEDVTWEDQSQKLYCTQAQFAADYLPAVAVQNALVMLISQTEKKMLKVYVDDKVNEITRYKNSNYPGSAKAIDWSDTTIGPSIVTFYGLADEICDPTLVMDLESSFTNYLTKFEYECRDHDWFSTAADSQLKMKLDVVNMLAQNSDTTPELMIKTAIDGNGNLFEESHELPVEEVLELEETKGY